MTGPQPFRVTWFSPDRPVEGNTVYVRPTPDVWVTASGWSTAHLVRTHGERPVTVCGRIVRQPRRVGVSFRRCHYCAAVAAERAKETAR